MKLLLDTHAFLWAVMQPDKLSKKVRRLLESTDTELIVSAASAWEIATKYLLGCLSDHASSLTYNRPSGARYRQNDD